jgi:hypothetical protein
VKLPPRAVSMFYGFHQFEPTDVGEFPRGFRIPTDAVRVGDGVNVMYRSDKFNPTTGEDEGVIDYIHKHKAGVICCRCDADARGEPQRVPPWIWKTKALIRLGDCLGFEYRDGDGRVVEARTSGRLPELYTIPSGKALLIIQGRRSLKAILWGGTLGVEPRGIVG